MSTPSDYSDGFSAEHDEMVAAVYDYLRSRQPPATMEVRGGTVAVKRVRLDVEYLITIKDVIRGFVDILEVLEVTEPGPMLGRQRITAFEIKPNITSVGGLIRQMKATAFLLERNTNGISAAVRSVPVVPHTDKNLSILRNLWPGLVWEWDIQKAALS